MDPEQLELLLTKYRGETPHGEQGDRQFRAGLLTGVLETTDENVRRDRLEPGEMNDLLAYLGWNMWDFLAMRSTEGESGLIPRQEYESLSLVQIWLRYPELYEEITRAVGADGVVELGATARREIGTKANIIHSWCCLSAVAGGRGACDALGLVGAGERVEELNTVLQFGRRLYHGALGGGPLMVSARGFCAPVLDRAWIDRFRDEVVELSDPERRRVYRLFNAATELLGFLIHFDCRAGMADTGPYDLGDGRVMIVRDHFLHEPVYHWADVADELPYCVTQAMVFSPPEGFRFMVNDGQTTFTEPRNYLEHLTAMTVYARDRWDTPVDEVRRLDEAQMGEITTVCHAATMRLYQRIAAMPRRDRIMAGVQVYCTDFILPFARAAGLWEHFVDDLDFFELDPRTSQAYYTLAARDGRAEEIMGSLILTGAGFAPVETA